MVWIYFSQKEKHITKWLDQREAAVYKHSWRFDQARNIGDYRLSRQQGIVFATIENTKVSLSQHASARPSPPLGIHDGSSKNCLFDFYHEMCSMQNNRCSPRAYPLCGNASPELDEFSTETHLRSRRGSAACSSTSAVSVFFFVPEDVINPWDLAINLVFLYVVWFFLICFLGCPGFQKPGPGRRVAHHSKYHAEPKSIRMSF